MEESLVFTCKSWYTSLADFQLLPEGAGRRDVQVLCHMHSARYWEEHVLVAIDKCRVGRQDGAPSGAGAGAGCGITLLGPGLHI